MSDQNVELVRAVYAEWAKGNLRAGIELFAPDICFEPAADGRSSFVGADAVAGYMGEFLAQWSDFRVDAEELLDVGDSIVVTERQRATGKTSGIKSEQVDYAIWTFRDGLVVRLRWEMDRAQALEAAGLGE